MISDRSHEPPIFAFRIRDIVLSSIMIGFALVVVGIVSVFRLSPEAAILRESALAQANGPSSKKIALHVGMLTTGLVRVGSHFFRVPAEPQAALDAIRGAEVGIYKLQGDAGVDHGAILARADKGMSARRWDRVVGVSREDELVAVYVPRRDLSTARAKCCVLVLKGRDLVVAGASGNLNSLVKIVDQHLDLARVGQNFAMR